MTNFTPQAEARGVVIPYSIGQAGMRCLITQSGKRMAQSAKA
jgi:hypothetical protein